MVLSAVCLPAPVVVRELSQDHRDLEEYFRGTRMEGARSMFNLLKSDIYRLVHGKMLGGRYRAGGPVRSGGWHDALGVLAGVSAYDGDGLRDDRERQRWGDRRGWRPGRRGCCRCECIGGSCGCGRRRGAACRWMSWTR